ncbi:MAG: polysaccharide deacetylase family protein [Gemmatimonadetes bacterium]|nr:polysaccharide deacetylase family protein [Gemmatimonadota bacterium]MBA4159829.1 polysaccharide deacetylase family protein [Gemmatimonadota bacterium]
MKRRVKGWLGAAAYHTRLYRRFFRNRAIIVLFHRVDDRLADDPLSCTSAEFDAYCRFFRRYFTVVSLEELLDRLERGEDISRHLVITFDDGYLDNHEVAAARLRVHEIPACFFIATNFIGSDYRPWWDAELPFAPQWMDWQEVRELHHQGFEIGAHTMNHVDLGVVVGGDAVAEIIGSRKRIERELRTEVPFFSYPYGRANQITEENREAVRRAGFRCCLSAYGGTVTPGVDLFDLPRVPISPWFASPYHFGLEAMLDR